MTDGLQFPASAQADAAPYRVLARKYRPRTFGQLIGQEALVRTLTNAIKSGRIAHAFVLTGVRGVGKTTTARIIARALNCESGPTIQPCGTCRQCVAIAEDRHLDIVEIDAASRTGVDDMRDLIDSIPYKPVEGRYKVYIIDEVHMLSKSAFNAILKTVEEPPEHVKFIFATTEARKIPATILSRCQRFDLRRVEADRLSEHFRSIAAQEGTRIDEEALALLSRAADGSVRDGLSLLDQAIAMSAGPVTGDAVRGMLGLTDRSLILDVVEFALAGDAPRALASVRRIRDAGGDPSLALKDMLELVHFVSVAAVAPQQATDPSVPEAERTRGMAMAKRAGLNGAQAAWASLIKAVPELQSAPAPAQALEMAVLRLAGQFAPRR